MFEAIGCKAIAYYPTFDGHQPSKTSVELVFMLF